MCVIVYKPADVHFPSYKTLERCFRYNDDGAGYMYAVNGRVFIRKGFMTFGSFKKSLRRTRKQYGDYIPYVMHFRISTQGGYKPELTHPFPLSEEMSDLKKLSCSSDVGIAHNGIISLTTSTKKDVDYNDTMLFITDYLSLNIRDTDYWKDPVTIELISRLADSKLAILDKNGHCELIGGFVIEDGVFYSNHSYQYGYAYSYLKTELYEDYMSYYGMDEEEFCPLMYGYSYEACLECPHKEDCYDSDEEIMRYIV